MSLNLYGSVLPKGEDAYTIFNMTEQEIDDIELRMRPGKYAEDGFLNDTEKLQDIFRRDLDSLCKMKVTCEQISQILRGILKTAIDTAKDRAIINIVNGATGKKLKISGISIISSTNIELQCPFHKLHACRHKEQQFYTITNLNTQQSFTFHHLAIFMIENHAFFGGSTRFRVDPEKVFQVLELKAGSIEKRIEKKWQLCKTHDFDYEGSDEEMAKSFAEKIEKIDEYATAYIGLPYRNCEKFRYRDMTKIQKIREIGKISHNTEKEIEREIEFEKKRAMIKGNQWDPNSPVFVSNGKKYCHIFNHRNLHEEDDKSGLHILVDDRCVVMPGGESLTVYEPVDINYAVVDF